MMSHHGHVHGCIADGRDSSTGTRWIRFGRWSYLRFLSLGHLHRPFPVLWSCIVGEVFCTHILSLHGLFAAVRISIMDD